MKAAEIMTKDVVTIESSATVAAASRLMSQKGVRALIVNRSSAADAYGIVSETDIIRKVIALGLNPLQIKVAAVMTKPCIVVNPDLAVEYVAGLFIKTGVQRAPIIQGKLQRLEMFEESGDRLETLPAKIYDAWCSG